MRHFKEGSALHKALSRADRTEIAGVAVYAFECATEDAAALLAMARDHCPPAVKDIEHALSAGIGS